MVNQPNQDMQGLQPPSAGKLVLPAPPDEGQYLQPYTTPIRPGRPIRHQASPAPHGLFTRLVYLWRKDSAYIVLSIAITMVIVASLVFVAFGASVLLNNNNNNGSTYAQHPSTPTPYGTVDNKPSFSTPATGQGSNTSSQPGAQPTPDLQASPTDNGPLDVQITNVPKVVANNTRVHVEVTTSEPNVDVRLQVTYDAPPYAYNGGQRTTDGNGNASLPWPVKVFALNAGDVQATVVVIATDQNGQQATSQPVTVLVQAG